MSNFETTPHAPTNESDKQAETWQQPDEDVQAAARSAEALFNFDEPALAVTLEGDAEPGLVAHGKQESGNLGMNILAGATVGAIAAGVGSAVMYDALGPKEIVSVATSTVGQGEDVLTAVQQDVAFLEKNGADPAHVDLYALASDANAIVSENGVTQAGAEVSIAAVQSPLSKRVTFEAVETPQQQAASDAQNESQGLTAPDTH